MRSAVAYGSFILEERHSLPVINISMSDYDLNDYHHGIYSKGPGADSEFPYQGANYWKKWWRDAHIEMFDSVGGGFSVDCQIAITGGFSRALDKKSFKIRFRDTHGPGRLTYDYFGTGHPMELRNFVLRGGAQDIEGIMARDEFFTSLMQPQCPELLIQAYRPVALYINRAYFGLYYIREKVDRHFVARHLGVSNDSVSIVKEGVFAEEGQLQGYRDLVRYVRNYDLSQREHYEYMKERFDLVGLIDFKLGEIYSCNTDIYNVRYVHSADSKGDRKWHIVFYDLDDTWFYTPSMDFYLSTSCRETFADVREHNVMVQELLKNSEFRQLFLERLSLHMHTTFTAKNTTATFDRLIASIRPEMPRNCERWSQYLSFTTWEKRVTQFRENCNTRGKTMLDALRRELRVTPEEEKKYFADLGF